MAPMRLLPAAGHRRMPWKNGGGETVEIAISPADAGLDGFDWRLSMATVATDGPFSVFPGIDRSLAVIRGAGMELSVAGVGSCSLDPAAEPFAFPADQPTTARLIDGPITDLNLMTRRAGFVHEMERMRVAGPVDLAVVSEVVLLLCVSGQVGVQIRGETVDLAPLDALLIDRRGLAEAGGGDGEGLLMVCRIRERMPA